MFVIGARWTEPLPEKAPAGAAAVPAAATASLWPAAVLTVAALALGPAASWVLQHPAVMPPVQVALPDLPGAPAADTQTLKLQPHFDGAAALAHRVYLLDGHPVTVHVGYYRHQTYGIKVTSSNNMLVHSEGSHWNRLSGGTVRVPVPGLGAEALAMRATQLVGGRTGAIAAQRDALVVRQVMWAGGRLTTNSQKAVAAGVLARLAGKGDDAAMLTIYTDGEGPAAARRVDAFIGQHLPALVAHLEQVRSSAR
jgi:EpsI family protein